MRKSCHAPISGLTIKTLAIGIIFLGVGGTAATGGDDDAPISIPPESLSLPALEQRVREAARRAVPAVVAVLEIDRGRQRSLGSGVIISADGLVLSQYHVTHMPDLSDPTRSRKPNERLELILQTGRRCRAELLGADRTYELSLLRIVAPEGPFAFAPLDPKVSLNVGDRVLKLGHPHGYQSGRDPVVRLGRVLCAHESFFATDCLVGGGDSGGPYFDLDGRLAGMVLAATIPERLRSASSPRSDALNAATTVALISTRLPDMLNKVISTSDAGQVFERFRSAEDVLPPDEWSQGSVVREAFRDVIKQAKSSVIAVRDELRVVALGTIVGADGLAVTKASVLPAQPRVELPSGRIVPAEVLGMEPAFDIALLKIGTTGVQPIEWSKEPVGAAGTIVAAPGLQNLPLAVGVVSVPTRNLEGPFPTSVMPPTRQQAAIPEVIGSAVQGRGYWVEFAEGAAARAGIQPGDVLLTIGDHPMRGHQDLVRCVEAHWAGEALAVRLLRAGRTHALTLRLRPQVLEWRLAEDGSRREKFPTVFEHDAPLFGHECGGPLVDLAGNALGITIARVGDYGCLAIPADRVEALLPELKSGKLAEHWTKYREAILARDAKIPTQEAGTVDEPVTMTLDELMQMLQKRRERFKSLLVEYDVRYEAHVDPKLLMSWNATAFRIGDDYQEFHRMAFSGPKRFSETVTPPQLYVRNAPADRVEPDPAAPASVALALERQRLEAMRSRQEGRTDHLFYQGRGQRIRYVFDGNDCFAWDEFQKKMAPKRASSFYFPDMYLRGLGLRPIDPQPDAQRRGLQQKVWFPENFGLYDECRVLPHYQLIDGAPCIVTEGLLHTERDGKRIEETDRIWFDPRLGLAPRRREQRVDGNLTEVWTNSKFEAFAPGCWLPWECTWTFYAPEWVAPEYRNQPAHSNHMRLRRARVNEVSEDLFNA